MIKKIIACLTIFLFLTTIVTSLCNISTAESNPTLGTLEKTPSPESNESLPNTDPFVVVPQEILQNNYELLELKQQALDSNRIELAKQIYSRYHDFSSEIARLHNTLSFSGQPSTRISTESVHGDSINQLQEKNHFESIHAKYQESIKEFKSQLPLKVEPKFISSRELFLNKPVGIFDEDFVVLSFTAIKTGEYKFYTGRFAGNGVVCDTMLQLYSDPATTNMIAQNDNANGTVFSEIRIVLEQGRTYYLKVSGDNLVADVRVEMPQITINLNTSLDIDQLPSDNTIYSFTPSTYGTFKISTDFYGGSSSSGVNDTAIYVYSDDKKTNELAFNDDDNSRKFSSATLNMIAGKTYYIRVAEFTGGKVHARLTVSQIETNLVSLSTGSVLNIRNTTFFSFTPSVTREYTFTEMTTSTNIAAPVTDIYKDANSISGSSGKSQFVMSLVAGTTYTIVMYDASLRNFDVNFSISLADNQPPTAPSELIVSEIKNNSITLSWTPSTDNVGVVRYNIYIRSTYIGSVSGSTTTYTVNGQANTTYSFTVRAMDDIGNESAASNEVSVIIDTQAPTVPSVLVSGITSSTVTLRWTASTDNVELIGYDIYNGTALIGSVNGSTTTYTAKGLAANTLYSFTIKAKDAAGNISAASNSISILLNGKLTYNYDSRGRLTSISITSTGQVVKSFSYDNNGNLKTVTKGTP
ncbi:hypothetical protein BC351_12295 [Paenibacillus ferrarius]|uniref:Fibronectin type-III domain-containing protein n=1 Tax=Paenibacillus ferrarius TaxID=1469647 RepID=A0A1V4H7V9_9BACL|nr:fibronectin type III domain-containing protein [Paenibacillus ferrarius]OPH47272.1 hypothetical protein BC351_12295 [Paenibacillus ferrarius]